MIPIEPWKHLSVLPLAAAMLVVAAARLGAEEAEEEPSNRLPFMKTSVAGYVVSSTKSPQAFDLISEPLLRWDNPVSKVPDGTLFLWKDEKDRPVAIVQVFIAANTKDLWLHEFQSLTTEPFRVQRADKPVWTPGRTGIVRKPVSDAPVPGSTKVARMNQMRQIARRFEVQDDFEGKSRWDLRLMATPLYRYGNDDDEVVDGALFAYAHGTDPEALLLLEARRRGEALEWHYALAPMTGYALRVKDGGTEIWSIESRMPPYDVNEPFLCIPFKP